MNVIVLYLNDNLNYGLNDVNILDAEVVRYFRFGFNIVFIRSCPGFARICHLVILGLLRLDVKDR